MFLLEYSEKQHCFHYNYYNSHRGRLQSKMFVNDYRPITIVSEDIATENWFLTIQAQCMRLDSSFEEASETILLALLNHLEKEE